MIVILRYLQVWIVVPELRAHLHGIVMTVVIVMMAKEFRVELDVW
jgi:hypothetical protein